MIGDGMKASELIKELEKMIKIHGDREVYSGGEDYPGGVSGVGFNKKDNAYEPAGSFRIWSDL